MQAYATPVALGEDIPEEIQQAKAMFEAAADAQKQVYTAKIDALQFSTADRPHNDTVYLVRNEPPATFETSARIPVFDKAGSVAQPHCKTHRAISAG